MQKKLTGKAGSLHQTMNSFFFVSDVGMFGFGASRSWLGKVASFGNLRWVIFWMKICHLMGFDGDWVLCCLPQGGMEFISIIYINIAGAPMFV